MTNMNREKRVRVLKTKGAGKEGIKKRVKKGD